MNTKPLSHRQRPEPDEPDWGDRRERRNEQGWSDSGLGPERLAAEAHLRSTHGFLVDTIDGREVGVVEDVVVDPASDRVVRLEVCGGWFGRRRRSVEVAEIEEIFPLERRLTVARSVVDPHRG